MKRSSKKMRKGKNLKQGQKETVEGREKRMKKNGRISRRTAMPGLGWEESGLSRLSPEDSSVPQERLRSADEENGLSETWSQWEIQAEASLSVSLQAL